MKHKKVRKEILVDSLPIDADGLVIRSLARTDIDRLSEWPPYPWPHDVFRFSFSGGDAHELDRAYDVRMRDVGRLTLVVDAPKASVIGYIALLRIDWDAGIVGNMSVRIHPDFCDQGIGSHVMASVRNWWITHGMKLLRLDVAATNHRAVRCYENVGFRKTGEFWRDAGDLIDQDLSDPKYRFLEDHVDCSRSVPRIRFYWMEAEIGE